MSWADRLSIIQTFYLLSAQWLLLAWRWWRAANWAERESSFSCVIASVARLSEVGIRLTGSRAVYMHVWSLGSPSVSFTFWRGCSPLVCFSCKSDSEKINHISQSEIESQQLLSGLTVCSDEEAENLMNMEWGSLLRWGRLCLISWSRSSRACFTMCSRVSVVVQPSLSERSHSPLSLCGKNHSRSQRLFDTCVWERRGRSLWKWGRS